MRTIIGAIALGLALLILVAKVLDLRKRLKRPPAQLKRDRVFKPLPNGQRIEVDPNDPTDPMHDEAVRAMLATVLETGRPMSMNRGEAPVFIDDKPQGVLVAHGDDDVVAVPVLPKEKP